MKLDIDFMVILFQCTQRNFFHTKGDISVRLYKLNYFLLRILLFSYFDLFYFPSFTLVIDISTTDSSVLKIALERKTLL